MNGDERMSIQERWKYLRLMQKRYQDADRSTKEQLLDEAQAVAGLHRKSTVLCNEGAGNGSEVAPMERRCTRR